MDSLWNLPLGLFLLLVGWFLLMKVSPNYASRYDTWWGDVIWFPLLGKYWPWKGEPERAWKFLNRFGGGLLILCGLCLVAASLAGLL